MVLMRVADLGPAHLDPVNHLALDYRLPAVGSE